MEYIHTLLLIFNIDNRSHIVRFLLGEKKDINFDKPLTKNREMVKHMASWQIIITFDVYKHHGYTHLIES